MGQTNTSCPATSRLVSALVVAAVLCGLSAGTALAGWPEDGEPTLPDPVAAARRDAGLQQVGHRFPPTRSVQGGYPAVIDNARLLSWVNTYSKKNRLDPRLVYALIEQESRFNPNAVSPKGAQGLMQIMPDTQKLLGLSTPFDPESSIAAGTRYLRTMLDKFQTEVMALAAYNAGPGAVAKHGGVPPYEETKDYVLRIVNRYFALRLRYPEEGIGAMHKRLLADEEGGAAARRKP